MIAAFAKSLLDFKTKQKLGGLLEVAKEASATKCSSLRSTRKLFKLRFQRILSTKMLGIVAFVFLSFLTLQEGGVHKFDTLHPKVTLNHAGQFYHMASGSQHLCSNI